MSKKKNKNPEGHFGGKPGYKNPPKSGQFKPGQSGNPKGRPPRKPTNVFDSFEDSFLKKEEVKVGGKVGYYAGIDLVFMKMKERAINSNNPAERKLFVDMLVKMGINERFNDFSDDELLAALASYADEETDE